MSVTYGIDCSDRSPAPAVLRMHRASFIARYQSYTNSKNLSAAEATMARNAAIGIVSVWETSANRALGGFYAGVSDARAAVSQLKANGAPKNVPIFFAVDFDATGQTARLLQYFLGAASVIGMARTGGYGGKAAIDFLYSHGFRRLWQTYAWSGGTWNPHAYLRQYSNGHTVGGVSVDLDYAIAADYGQWNFSPPPPKPPLIKRVVAAVKKPVPPPIPHVAALLGPWKARPTKVRPGYKILGPTGGTHLWYERKL